ncbi:hypothetical protein K2173_006000 [Erythroxylum novogranatense]|uniref:Pentatricopeptide repeat-containing protein n=1 Tax=Erythroxylum novogranatense TaxID=1862640 RepID=A0AAV8TBY7_9ROSI|nr:hypothetical protein K2173_006000 [Erythroxylum novogranatense]
MASSLRLRHLCTAANCTSTFSISSALQIYSFAFGKYNSPLSSPYAQELTIRRLAKSQRFTDIETLLRFDSFVVPYWLGTTIETNHKNNLKIKQEPFLGTLIRSYGQAGMFDHALRTFEQMDELGTSQSVISFNALLSACTWSKLYITFPVLFNDVSSKYGILPDSISYGILIKSYCDAGMPEKAVERLSEMKEKGLEVSAVTFTTIVSSFYKKGKSEEAKRLWNEMVKKGRELDVAAFNVKIMHSQGGKPEKVKEFMEEMGSLGLKPDAISYNYLMISYCKTGRMEEAENVYKSLQENDAGEYEKWYKFFKGSVRVRKIPDFAIMKGLVVKKKMKEAKGVIGTIKKTFPPNLLNA